MQTPVSNNNKCKSMDALQAEALKNGRARWGEDDGCISIDLLRGHNQ